MEYTKGECGCRVVIAPDKMGYGIIYCSKHKASPDMYEALKAVRLLSCSSACSDIEVAVFESDYVKVKEMAYKALAKAEGK